MTRRIPIACEWPHCSRTVVGRRRCEEHSAPPRRERRGSASSRGYDRKWQRLRNQKLRAEPLCRSCKFRGDVVSACEVDHIVPLNDGGTHDWENLQSLCRPCHAKKTADDVRRRREGRGGTVCEGGTAVDRVRPSRKSPAKNRPSSGRARPELR